MKTIRTDSFEIFKHNVYESFQIGDVHGFVNQNAYISVVATNNCQCSCPYCINSATDKQLNLPIEKALHNIGELTTYINNEPEAYYHPREAYAALIDRISGKGTFESNPYVFVYEFELIK